MTALYIIGGILLFFFLLAMIRAEVIIKYADDFALAVKICGIKINILPARKKRVRIRDFTPKKIAARRAREQKKAEKAAAKKKAKAAEKAAKKQREQELKRRGKLKKKPIGETISLILALVKTAVGRFARHLRVRIARLHINVATGDAAKTAILYGTISQSVAYIAALLDSVGTLTGARRADVDVHADYLSETTTADIEIGFSLRVWQVFDILIRTAVAFVKHEAKK